MSKAKKRKGVKKAGSNELKITSTKNGLSIEGLNAVLKPRESLTWKTVNCSAEIQFDKGTPFPGNDFTVPADGSTDSGGVDPAAVGRYEYTIVVRRSTDPYTVTIDPQVEVDDTKRKPRRNAKKGGRKHKKP